MEYTRLLHTVCLTGALVLSSLTFVSIPSDVVANELTPEQDARNRLNFAGRQRMLTQQIARNACFVMAGIDPDRFVAKTDAAVRQFNTALYGLRHGDTNLGLFEEQQAAVLSDLEAVEILWRTLGAASRQIAAGDTHPVPMEQLIRLNVETKDAMNTAVHTIEKHYGDRGMGADLARTINLAGRQRMLSQRASKEVCFFVLDITSGGSAEMVQATLAEFDTAMNDLLEGSQKRGIIAPPDRQIKKQLERTQKAWDRFKKLLSALETGEALTAGDRVTLANLSDQVLREMDLAVWMYSEQ